MIRSRLGAIGDWDLSLLPETPPQVLAKIREGDFLIVVPSWFDPRSVAVSSIKSLARYAGQVDSVDGVQLRGSDLAAQINDVNGNGAIFESPLIGNTTLSSWMGAIVPVNGITAGTINNTGLASISHTFPAGTTALFAIKWLAAVLGAGWRVNPSGTIDMADPALLYPAYTTPTTIATRQDGGIERNITGLHVTDLSYEIDVSKWTSRPVVIAQGEGGAVSLSFVDNPSNPYVGWGGTALVRKTLVDSPQTESGNGAVVGSAVLDLLGEPRRLVKIETDTYDVGRYIQVGDSMYLHDDLLALRETAVQDWVDGTSVGTINYRGRTLVPQSLRLFELEMAVAPGMGVFLYRPGFGDITDLTGFTVWEDPGAKLVCGAAQESIFEHYFNLPTSRIGPGALEDAMERSGRAYQVTELTRNAQQSITNATRTAVSWDVEVQDTLGLWSSGTTLTIPATGAGMWHITLESVLASNTVNADAYIDIDFNSAGAVYRAKLEAGAGGRGVCSGVRRLAAGDTVQGFIRHANGAAVNAQARIIMLRLGF